MKVIKIPQTLRNITNLHETPPKLWICISGFGLVEKKIKNHATELDLTSW